MKEKRGGYNAANAQLAKLIALSEERRLNISSGQGLLQVLRQEERAKKKSSKRPRPQKSKKPPASFTNSASCPSLMVEDNESTVPVLPPIATLKGQDEILHLLLHGQKKKEMYQSHSLADMDSSLVVNVEVDMHQSKNKTEESSPSLKHNSQWNQGSKLQNMLEETKENKENAEMRKYEEILAKSRVPILLSGREALSFGTKVVLESSRTGDFLSFHENNQCVMGDNDKDNCARGAVFTVVNMENPFDSSPVRYSDSIWLKLDPGVVENNSHLETTQHQEVVHVVCSKLQVRDWGAMEQKIDEKNNFGNSKTWEVRQWVTKRREVAMNEGSASPFLLDNCQLPVAAACGWPRMSFKKMQNMRETSNFMATEEDSAPRPDQHKGSTKASGKFRLRKCNIMDGEESDGHHDQHDHHDHHDDLLDDDMYHTKKTSTHEVQVQNEDIVFLEQGNMILGTVSPEGQNVGLPLFKHLDHSCDSLLRVDPDRKVVEPQLPYYCVDVNRLDAWKLHICSFMAPPKPPDALANTTTTNCDQQKQKTLPAMPSTESRNGGDNPIMSKAKIQVERLKNAYAARRDMPKAISNQMRETSLQMNSASVSRCTLPNGILEKEEYFTMLMREKM
jgi:hypothetical protein